MGDLSFSTLLFFFYLHPTLLVEQMGDERFVVRESASGALVCLLRHDGGVWLVPLVEHAVRHRDPEVARRAGLARDEFYNVWPTSWDRIPWIDMLPPAMPDRQGLLDRYLSLARAGAGPPDAPDWPDYRQATVYYVHDLIRAGTPRSHVVRLLDEMSANERQYLARR